MEYLSLKFNHGNKCTKDKLKEYINYYVDIEYYDDYEGKRAHKIGYIDNLDEHSITLNDTRIKYYDMRSIKRTNCPHCNQEMPNKS